MRLSCIRDISVDTASIGKIITFNLVIFICVKIKSDLSQIP